MSDGCSQEIVELLTYPSSNISRVHHYFLVLSNLVILVMVIMLIEYSPKHKDHLAFVLPHRGIHRNGKLRVVFDGSAKDGLGKSLNSYRN